MSEGASDADLTIALRFAKQAAEQMSRQRHKEEEQRTRQMADTQPKAEADFVRTINKSVQSKKRRDREKAQAAEQAAKEIADAALRAAKPHIEASTEANRVRQAPYKELAALAIRHANVDLETTKIAKQLAKEQPDAAGRPAGQEDAQGTNQSIQGHIDANLSLHLSVMAWWGLEQNLSRENAKDQQENDRPIVFGREAVHSVITPGDVETLEEPLAAITTTRKTAYGHGQDRFGEETGRSAFRDITRGIQPYEASRERLNDRDISTLGSAPTDKTEAANPLLRLCLEAKGRIAKGLLAEAPGGRTFQRRARELVEVNAHHDRRKFSQEQLGKEANALMMSALPREMERHLPRRTIKEPPLPFLGNGFAKSPHSMTWPQTAGLYAHDVNDAPACHPNTDQAMKQLKEAAKNLHRATWPQVPPAHPAAPFVMRR